MLLASVSGHFSKAHSDRGANISETKETCRSRNLTFRSMVFGFVSQEAPRHNSDRRTDISGGASASVRAAGQSAASSHLHRPMSQSRGMLLGAVRRTRPNRTSAGRAVSLHRVGCRTGEGRPTGGPIDLPSSLTATTRASRSPSRLASSAASSTRSELVL